MDLKKTNPEVAILRNTIISGTVGDYFGDKEDRTYQPRRVSRTCDLKKSCCEDELMEGKNGIKQKVFAAVQNMFKKQKL